MAEHDDVASLTDTVADPFDSDDEGPLREEDDDDVMVEVVGSDVFVDGLARDRDDEGSREKVPEVDTREGNNNLISEPAVPEEVHDTVGPTVEPTSIPLEEEAVAEEIHDTVGATVESTIIPLEQETVAEEIYMGSDSGAEEVSESASDRAELVAERVSVTVCEETLESELDKVGSGSVIEAGDSDRDKNTVFHLEVKSLDHQVEVIVGKEAEDMNKVESLHSEGDLCQSVEDKQIEPATGGGQNLKSIGDVPTGMEVENQSKLEDQELVEVEPPSSVKIPENVAEDSISEMDNTLTDSTVHFSTTNETDKTPAAVEKEGGITKPEIDIAEVDGVFLAESRSSQDCGANLKESTTVKVEEEEVLDCVDKVAGTNEICNGSSSGEGRNLESDKMAESGYGDNTVNRGLEPSAEQTQVVLTDDLEGTTAVKVEEILTYENEVAGTDDVCYDSSEKGDNMETDHINESSIRELKSSAEQTQTKDVLMNEDLPNAEVDVEATVGNGSEALDSGFKTVNNGDERCFPGVEQLNDATACGTNIIFNIDQENDEIAARRLGVDGQSESAVIDSHEHMPVSQKAEAEAQSKVETLGETSVKDESEGIGSSPVDQPTVNNSKSVSSSLGPSVNEHEKLEVHVTGSGIASPSLNGDQITATCPSDAVHSDAVGFTEEIVETCLGVEHKPQGMVLNKSTVGSLVVDLDRCVVKNEELVKENDRLDEESDIVSDMEFSEYFDMSASTNGDLSLDVSGVLPQAEVPEKSNDMEQGEKDIEMTEHVSDLEPEDNVNDNISTQTALKPKSKVDFASHLLPHESEGELSISDLVWGKVKSHPWWPGQIFDPADASEKAMKHHKKDSFLVAYFGDRTFAWNEASVLKPFWSSFSHIEKQNSSETFQNAITSALEEVSRRIMLGLACSCIPSDVYSKIESQIVENTGICQESSVRFGVDESTGVNSLQPNKLLEYIRALAESPLIGVDRLGFVIAKAQLLAFNQLRGCYSLPEFQFCGGLLESDESDEVNLDEAKESLPNGKQIVSNKRKLESDNRSSNKRKHNLKDGLYSSKRERRLSELMSEEGSEEQDKRISFYAAKVSTTVSPIPKPSFKVGDCIRRAATQLTGSPSVLRNGNEKLIKADGITDLHTPDNWQEGGIASPMEYSSLDQMLLKLQMLARDPLKGHSFSNSVTNFFSGFRDSINLCQYTGRQSSSMGRSGGFRKRKASHAFVGSPEEFEFDDDVNDSYWTDMIIQNNSEEPPSVDGQNRHYQLVVLDPDKSNKSSRRSYSRKRFSNGDHHELATEEPLSYIDQRRQDNLPTELILNFSEAASIPSEINLNKIFRRFGPLKETESETDLETGRARVVFKRCSDAEVAFSSAGRFNIFGTVLVNYELNYSPSVSFSTFPLAASEGQEDAT